jgi:hypothetical protein
MSLLTVSISGRVNGLIFTAETPCLLSPLLQFSMRRGHRDFADVLILYPCLILIRMLIWKFGKARANKIFVLILKNHKVCMASMLNVHVMKILT